MLRGERVQIDPEVPRVQRPDALIEVARLASRTNTSFFAHPSPACLSAPTARTAAISLGGTVSSSSTSNHHSSLASRRLVELQPSTFTYSAAHSPWRPPQPTRCKLTMSALVRM